MIIFVFLLLVIKLLLYFFNSLQDFNMFKLYCFLKPQIKSFKTKELLLRLEFFGFHFSKIPMKVKLSSIDLSHLYVIHVAHKGQVKISDIT